uniref:Uncharacterized protein n=1 Tax=Anopheles merus TaxID=30066 RepID=A0A182VBM3_ANOME
MRFATLSVELGRALAGDLAPDSAVKLMALPSPNEPRLLPADVPLLPLPLPPPTFFNRQPPLFALFDDPVSPAEMARLFSICWWLLSTGFGSIWRWICTAADFSFATSTGFMLARAFSIMVAVWGSGTIVTALLLLLNCDTKLLVLSLPLARLPPVCTLLLLLRRFEISALPKWWCSRLFHFISVSRIMSFSVWISFTNASLLGRFERLFRFGRTIGRLARSPLLLGLYGASTLSTARWVAHFLLLFDCFVSGRIYPFPGTGWRRFCCAFFGSVTGVDVTTVLSCISTALSFPEAPVCDVVVEARRSTATESRSSSRTSDALLAEPSVVVVRFSFAGSPAAVKSMALSFSFLPPAFGSSSTSIWNVRSSLKSFSRCRFSSPASLPFCSIISSSMPAITSSAVGSASWPLGPVGATLPSCFCSALVALLSDSPAPSLPLAASFTAPSLVASVSLLLFCSTVSVLAELLAVGVIAVVTGFLAVGAEDDSTDTASSLESAIFSDTSTAVAVGIFLPSLSGVVLEMVLLEDFSTSGPTTRRFQGLRAN